MAVSKGGLIFLSLCSAFVPDEVVSLLTLIHSPTSIWQEVHIIPIKTNAGAIRVHDKHGIFQQGAAGLRTRSPLLKGFLDADCSSAGRKKPLYQFGAGAFVILRSSRLLMSGQMSLCIQRGHASGSGGGDGLAIVGVLDIAAGK